MVEAAEQAFFISDFEEQYRPVKSI